MITGKSWKSEIKDSQYYAFKRKIQATKASTKRKKVERDTKPFSATSKSRKIGKTREIGHNVDDRVT